MYYIRIDDMHQYGPYTEEQVRAMIATEKIPPDVLVYKQDGDQQWQPASNFPLLRRPPGKRARNLAFDPVSMSVAIPVEREIERIIWKARPSNLEHIDDYIKYCLILLLLFVAYLFGSPYIRQTFLKPYMPYLVVGLIIVIVLKAIWEWVELKCTKWTLTTERFTYSFGVFSRRTDYMELYRVEDLIVRKPFLLRIFKYGYIDLITRDETDPVLPNVGPVKHPEEVCEMFRKYTERQRERQRERRHVMGSTD